MRILVVPSDFPTQARPSAGIFILRQLQALAELGHDMRVLRIVPHAPPLLEKWRKYRAIPAHYIYEGIPVTTIRAIVPPRMIGLDFVRRQAAPSIRTEIERFKPDLIHAHCLIPPGFIVMNLGQPVVLTAHGSDAYLYPKQRKDLRRAAVKATQNATAVTAVSQYLRREIESLGRRDVQVILNGADEKVFFPQDRARARAELGIDGGRSLIVYAGNIIHSKGVFDLVNAATALKDMRPLVMIAGEGSEKNALIQAFRKAQVEARFCGTLPHRELACLFAAADVFALPSYGEGLGTVICEAMLAGRAIVATKVGGIPEILENTKTGLLVPAGDRKAMARALRNVLLDAELRRRLETNARAFAVENLTWHYNAKAYDALYCEVLSPYDAVR